MKIITIADLETIRKLTEELKVTLNRADRKSLSDAFREEKLVEEYSHILNTYSTDDYAAVLRNKSNPFTLISIEDIFKAYGKKYLFIPNIMGVLRKYKQDIISPNEFYLSSRKESNGQDKEYERFILCDMLDKEYVQTYKPIESPGYYIRNNFLIIAQEELITWKVEEKYIEKYNKELHDDFFEANKDNKIFGKNGDRSPCTSDFIQYVENNSYLLDGVTLVKPKVLIYYVSIPTIKLNLTNNLNLKNRKINIHESIASKLL